MDQVRAATIADVPALMDMGRAFHAAAYSAFGDLDEAAAEHLLRAIIQSSHGVVLTNGRGAIGGVMAPFWFQPKTVIMEECFWWSPAGGGRGLMEEFIATARRMGATAVLLSTIENERAEAVCRAVRRLGFQPHERRHMLRLD